MCDALEMCGSKVFQALDKRVAGDKSQTGLGAYSTTLYMRQTQIKSAASMIRGIPKKIIGDWFFDFGVCRGACVSVFR